MGMADNNNNSNKGRGPRSCGESSVEEFYRGGTVLVTGATGFVGKALVEKLLRSCPGLEAVYLLIRSKKGMGPQARLSQLLENNVFDRLRNTGQLSKVVGVAGDVMEPGLGLSQADRELLTRKVTVVFHSAATVKFNETLKDAVRLNTVGTQAVIELCRHMVNLQAVVHVSTAYSNADKIVVEEKVYSPPASPDWIISCVQQSPEMLDYLELALTQNHPNTYTVTKAMAESVVLQQAEELPIAIVRPSIVTGAWKEPFPGWVDNVSGITGIMMEIGRGTIRSIICNDKYLVDIIPVDFVVDTLIVAAWQTATYRKGSIPVYNCTSGRLNPILWKELGQLTLKHSKTVPSKYVQWYPGFSFTTNRFLHNFKDITMHTFPAFLLDVVLRVKGSKPMNFFFNTPQFVKGLTRPNTLDLLNNRVYWSMLKLCKRFRVAAATGEFFALHEWKFSCDNQLSLYKDMGEEDRAKFNTDISKLNWDEYVNVLMVGIRKYVLKDSLESLPSAMKKLNRLKMTELVEASYNDLWFVAMYRRLDGIEPVDAYEYISYILKFI